MFDRHIHKSILLQILKDVYTNSSLGPLLGFKGGTAAHLFYNLGRFSVDLDFDLLDDTKETFIFEKIENILKEYGVTGGPSTNRSLRNEHKENSPSTLRGALNLSSR